MSASTVRWWILVGLSLLWLTTCPQLVDRAPPMLPMWLNASADSDSLRTYIWKHTVEKSQTNATIAGPSLSLWLTTCPELVGQAPRMVQPGQSWDKERIKSSNWVEKSSYCCIDKKGKSSQCAVRQIPADQGLFESRWAMKWCLDVVRLRSSGILILNRSNEWEHDCVRGGGRPGSGQDLPVAGLHQAGNIISVKPI